MSAKVEYSDLKSEEGTQALDKLVQQLIPQVMNCWPQKPVLTPAFFLAHFHDTDWKWLPMCRLKLQLTKWTSATK